MEKWSPEWIPVQNIDPELAQLLIDEAVQKAVLSALQNAKW